MCIAISFGANVPNGNCYGSNTFLLGFPPWCPPLDPLRKRWGPFLAAQNVAHQAFWSCQNSHAENTKKCWAWKEGTSVSWKDDYKAGDLVKQGATAQINRKLGGRNTYWGRSLNKQRSMWVWSSLCESCAVGSWDHPPSLGLPLVWLVHLWSGRSYKGAGCCSTLGYMTSL